MPSVSGPQSIAEQDERAAGHPEHSSLEARLLRRLLSSLGDPPIEFHLAWSGERIAPTAVPATERVRIADRATLRGLLTDTQIRFGDAYSTGQIEIEGDLVRFMEMVFQGLNRPSARESIAARVAGWLPRPRRNSLAGSRDNIHRHYDLGNDFYSLWLGKTMAYTCAYYPSAEATLDQAQVAKMEHVCRKLRIAASDRVVEAGCGWGSLALHIARRHGAKVRAFNISKEQLEFARHRARALGLTHRVEFIEDDYRNIQDTADVFVSVGMLEHVGLDNYPELGRVVSRSLSNQGSGFI